MTVEVTCGLSGRITAAGFMPAACARDGTTPIPSPSATMLNTAAKCPSNCSEPARTW
ncbi:hypothetical protein D3C72_2015120 [compost metagenome]